jgi:hypothetical protein
MGWLAAGIPVSPTWPPSPACALPESPHAGEHSWFPDAYSLRGKESGKSDGEAAAASSQAVQYA